MLGVADVLSGSGILVKQALHLVAADDVGGDNLFHVVRADGGVEGVVGDNLDDGAFLAEPEAAGNNHFHFVGHAVGLERCAEVFYDLCTVGGFATGTAATQDLHVRRTFFKAAGRFLDGFVAFLPDGQLFNSFPSDVF